MIQRSGVAETALALEEETRGNMPHDIQSHIQKGWHMRYGWCVDSNEKWILGDNYIELKPRGGWTSSSCPKTVLEESPGATGSVYYTRSKRCFEITGKDIMKGDGKFGRECTVFKEPDQAAVLVTAENLQDKVEQLEIEAENMAEVKAKLDDDKIAVSVGWCMGPNKDLVEHADVFNFEKGEKFLTPGKCVAAVLAKNQDSTGAVHDCKHQRCYGLTTEDIIGGDARYKQYECIAFKK